MNKEERQRTKQRRAGAGRRERTMVQPNTAGVRGGRFQPLTATDLSQIDSAIRTVLSEIGLADAPPIAAETILSRGGHMKDDGRLTFAQALIDDFLAGCQREITLYGQRPGHELHLTDTRVYVGSGGAAPQVIDLDTGRYRASTLRDLYDAARLVDALEHIHFFSRSLVARDMPDAQTLDINTAYVSLAGTAKHVCTSASHPNHVHEIAALCHTIAGSQQAFQDRPFLSLNINHVVPPLRFHTESCEVMAVAAKLGIPIHANAFGQVGASSPVTLAGSVVQNVAEALAGMIFAWLINPEAKLILGVRPMITDLRTGSMSGGSGEQALIMAATIQMARYYNLPNSCIAGATDSKVADAQSGYEKGLTVTLAAHAGANLITQACGMQAGLLGVAFESYVIDNDMLGAVLRSLGPLAVEPSTLAVDMINDIVHGEGHFLGHAETYNRMQRDFLYPAVADRRSPQEWEEDGAQEMRARAQVKTRDLLAHHFPAHINSTIDQKIRSTFAIQLPQIVMRQLTKEKS